MQMTSADFIKSVHSGKMDANKPLANEGHKAFIDINSADGSVTVTTNSIHGYHEEPAGILRYYLPENAQVGSVAEFLTSDAIAEHLADWRGSYPEIVYPTQQIFRDRIAIEVEPVGISASVQTTDEQERLANLKAIMTNARQSIAAEIERLDTEFVQNEPLCAEGEQAFIDIDLRDGEVSVGMQPANDRSKPAKVWTGDVVRFDLPTQPNTDGLVALLRDNAENFVRHRVAIDEEGEPHFDPETLDEEFGELVTNTVRPSPAWDFADYYGVDDKTLSLDDADRIFKQAQDDGIYFAGEGSQLDIVKQGITDILASRAEEIEPDKPEVEKPTSKLARPPISGEASHAERTPQPSISRG